MSLQLETFKSNARRFLKRGGYVLLVGLILGAIGYFFYRDYNYSEGTRSGVLIKISKKGWLFKTYEGQLNLAGNGGMMTDQSKFEFSATTKAFEQLSKLEGKAVTVHYNQKVNAFVWQGDTNYIVDSATAVGN